MSDEYAKITHISFTDDRDVFNHGHSEITITIEFSARIMPVMYDLAIMKRVAYEVLGHALVSENVPIYKNRSNLKWEMSSIEKMNRKFPSKDE